jgi:hypothetical protein
MYNGKSANLRQNYIFFYWKIWVRRYKLCAQNIKEILSQIKSEIDELKFNVLVLETQNKEFRDKL